MYQPPLCKNDRCSKLVGPSKNPGVIKEFCEPACRRRFHSRKQYARERGSGEGISLHDGIAWFNRLIARTSKTARLRLDEHNADCPFTTVGGACPARYDTYNRKKLCLIRAVLDEDWGQLMAAEEGRAFERELTTLDGHWKSDVPESKYVAQSRQAMTMSDEERAALIAAGAARPS